MSPGECFFRSADVNSLFGEPRTSNVNDKEKHVKSLTKRTSRLWMCVSGALAASAALAAPTLTYIPAPDGNPVGALPWCMSGDGAMIYGDVNGGSFRWTFATGSTALISPGAAPHVSGTDRDGTVAVGAATVAGLRSAARWVDGAPGVLPSGGEPGQARSVSADGQVVVGYIGLEGGPTRAASWTNGGFVQYHDDGMGWSSSTVLDASADGSRMIGVFQTAATGTLRRAVLFTPDGAEELVAPIDSTSFPPRPFEFQGVAFITDDGQAIVAQFQQPSTGWYRIFRWSQIDSEWTPIPMPPNDVSVQLMAVSADGGTIAGLIQRHSQFFGYVWTQPTGWFNLRQLLIDNNLPDLGEPLIITGVSDDGLQLGFHDGIRGYLLSMTSLPCPADFNGDGQVDFSDYLDFIQALANEEPRADFNRSGQVDFFDYLDFVAAFAAGCA